MSHEVFDLSRSVGTLFRDGTSGVVEAPGRPVRIDGFSVGAPTFDQPAPHRGELHPDGDELLYVVSGRVEVILDDGDHETVGAETVIEVGAGQAYIVPKGVWHRVMPLEMTHLVHITPGPGDGHRPL